MCHARSRESVVKSAKHPGVEKRNDMQRDGFEYSLSLHRYPEWCGGIQQGIEIGEQSTRSTRLASVHAGEDDDLLPAIAKTQRINRQAFGGTRNLPQFAGITMRGRKAAKALQAIKGVEEPVALLFT